MCGRVNVSDNEGVRLLLSMLGMDVWPSRDPRFNVAPTQTLDVVVQDAQTGAPTLTAMRWGLIPSWARPDKYAPPLINARSETIFEKASFRRLIPEQRVLIPINGFYEWRREGKQRTPFLITARDAPAMWLAGIWQAAANPDQEKAQACIVTTAANDSMQAVHDRMPVLLDNAEAQRWIETRDRAVLEQLMQPASNDLLSFSEVSSYVNSARNEGPQCAQAVS